MNPRGPFVPSPSACCRSLRRPPPVCRGRLIRSLSLEVREGGWRIKDRRVSGKRSSSLWCSGLVRGQGRWVARGSDVRCVSCVRVCLRLCLWVARVRLVRTNEVGVCLGEGRLLLCLFGFAFSCSGFVLLSYVDSLISHVRPMSRLSSVLSGRLVSSRLRDSGKGVTSLVVFLFL